MQETPTAVLVAIRCPLNRSQDAYWPFFREACTRLTYSRLVDRTWPTSDPFKIS